MVTTAGGGGVGGGGEGEGGGGEGGGGEGGGGEGEGGGGEGGGGEGGGGHILTPVQVFPAPNSPMQADGRMNSRKHEVLAGQPEVGAPISVLNAHLGAELAS